MKTANFILSIFATLCSLGMIYGAIVTESPIKSVSVIIFSIMKTIGEIMNEIEHIPKCPKNGEVNLLYLIEIIKK